MKTNFHHINRRLHLYLGMFCLPWFIMYGITSIAFNHNSWFNDGKGQPGGEFKEVGSWPCTVDVGTSGEIPKEKIRELIAIAGLDTKAFGSNRQGAGKVVVYLPSFTKMRQLLYFYEEGRLVLNERKKFTQQFLTGLHVRAGYEHDSFLNDAWALVVDVVCTAFVLWVITGVIIWWRVKKMRAWGIVALLGGMASFAGFMLWL
jgi:hypothetical protein